MAIKHVKKPQKPRKDFPLGAANNGQWCKKVRGKIHYFGIWANPDAAEAEYLRVKEYLQAGRRPPSPEAAGLQLKDLCNKFLNAKRSRVDSGELSARTFQGYHAAAAELLSHFGAERLVDDCRPEDFESFRGKVATTRGVHGISKMVTVVRTIFGFGFNAGLIEKPIIFGPAFTRATAKSVRIHRAKKQNEHGLRMLEAAEIRSLLKAASPPLKAMIFLAANGALGNSDMANLPQSAIKGDWLQYARVKTGVDRRIPLWPETLQSLSEAIEKRPRAKDKADAGLCFITSHGQKWVRIGPNGTSVHDLVSGAFAKLLKKLDLKREGLGFYALRHTFETVAGGCGDQVAVSAIMGHTQNDMASLYRERIDDERLEKAVNHVHAWLFGE